MARKFGFYRRYGVEEYYLYDPDDNTWAGFYRADGDLVEIANMGTWVSPCLGLRFDVEAPEMRVLRPDGRPFLTYLEQVAARKEAEAGRQAAEAERQAAEQEIEVLKAKMRAAGIDPDG
jgi:hypothetical protein